MKRKSLGIRARNTKYQIPISVSKNGEIKYERANLVMKVLRVPVVLFLNFLPPKICKFLMLTLSSPRGGAADVRRWPTSYRAIETMYTYPERRQKGETSIFEYFWFYSLNNPQALRNRLLLTTHWLKTKINEIAKEKKTVRLLSLGCGSTRAIMTALSAFNGRIDVKAKLLDISTRAINFSKELAKEKGVDFYQIEWYRDRLQNLEKYCDTDFQPDVVEMVGLLDYFEKEESIEILKKIYRVLAPNGWLITCNIRPNFERPFLTKGVNWPMIYRTPEELIEIVLGAGFPPENVEILYEPLKIHGLAIAQKIA